MSKRFLSSVLSVVLAASLVGCGGKGTNTSSTNDTANQSEIDKIIAEAQTMSLEELGKKAIEESNGSQRTIRFSSSYKLTPLRIKEHSQ